MTYNNLKRLPAKCFGTESDMQRNDCYMLKEISNVKYILPFGQMISDHRRGIQVNDTGAFIWQALKKDISAEELVSLCAEHFNVADHELAAVRKDINTYLSNLYSLGMIKPTGMNCSHFGEFNSTLNIAGLKINLSGPRECFSDNFNAFACKSDPCGDTGSADQTVIVSSGAPFIRENGYVVIRNPELAIMELADKYIFIFPQAPQILEASMSKDAKIVRFNCLPPFDDAFRENLFHAIRLGFLYLAQLHGMAVIHSASVLYRDRAWLFSGHSGMGKSTHTNLWHELLQTPLINGDLNLITLINDVPMVRGIPWCGTSGIYDTGDYRLGGIILLDQSPDNRIEELTADKKRLLISQRFISPFWSEKMMSVNLDLADNIAGKILICKLHCTKDKSSVETMKAVIDSYLS